MQVSLRSTYTKYTFLVLKNIFSHQIMIFCWKHEIEELSKQIKIVLEKSIVRRSVLKYILNIVSMYEETTKKTGH